MRYIQILTIALLLILFNYCKHEPILPEPTNDPEISVNCDPDTVYFVNDILPLLNSNCATSGCHDAQTAKDGVILTDYASIIHTRDVKAGDPQDSEIYEVITETGDDRMPPEPNAGLSSAQKELIRKWISQGAKNNACEDDCNLTNVGFAADIMPIINTNCTACHSGSTPNGNVRLTNYTEISTLAQSGYLLDVLTASNGAPQMPTSGRISDCNIDKIRVWTEAGALDN